VGWGSCTPGSFGVSTIIDKHDLVLTCQVVGVNWEPSAGKQSRYIKFY
jgi:hypothetical protein